MRKFILIGICLCASVFLFSQQTFAALQPLADLSSFEQTGTFTGVSGMASGSSTSWSSSSSGSWSVSPTTVISGTPYVSGGTYPSDFYYTVNLTYATSTMSFYYNGSEYTSTGSGTGTNVYHFVGGVFDPSGSTSATSASGSEPINDIGGTFTGFYLNNLQLHGNMTSYNSNNGAIGGNIYSITGSISPVPIPAAFWLLGSGIVGLVGIRRKFNV